MPDTSPRGLNLPGEHESYNFGSGAGFYLNATQEPWAAHYRMYDYITQELPQLVFSHYLGLDQNSWAHYDACALINSPLDYRSRAGYDHSYFFIASFIEDHLRYHAQHLFLKG